MAATYQALQVADEHTVEDFTCLVTVANVLECLGSILSSNIKQNFLSTPDRQLAKPFHSLNGLCTRRAV
jgi:hypothetical protein